MVIENRDAVVAGTMLTASYKKQQYVCTVEAGEDGKLSFTYDGKSYNSPSSAGAAVMGTACNGWRFWSIEGEASAVTRAPRATITRAPKATSTPAKTTAKPRKVVYKNPNQGKLAQGQVRWFCTACMKGFVVIGDTAQDACPEGHRNDDPEFSGAPAPEAVAADKADALTD